jgi:hypothetical protein
LTRVIFASSAGSWSQKKEQLEPFADNNSTKIFLFFYFFYFFYSVCLMINVHGMRVCVTPAAALLSVELSSAVPASEPEEQVASVNLYIQHCTKPRARRITTIW